MLKQYQFAQCLADTIASVLSIDVTIINNRYVRMAGTGPYRSLVGLTLPKRYISNGRSQRPAGSLFPKTERQTVYCRKDKTDIIAWQRFGGRKNRQQSFDNDDIPFGRQHKSSFDPIANGFDNSGRRRIPLIRQQLRQVETSLFIGYR